MDPYKNGLEIAQGAREYADALNIDNTGDAAADLAIRLAGLLAVQFTGAKNGYRRNGGDVEATASIAGVPDDSVGPGILFQLAGIGSVGTPSEPIRGPRLSAGPLDTMGIYHSERYDTNYKAWDSTVGFDHPSLAVTVPVEPNTSCRILGVTVCEVYPATTNTRVSGSVIIGANGVNVVTPSWSNDASNGRRTYVHRAQQWYTLIALHIRRIEIDTETPTPGGEPVTVRTRLFREGQAGNNRLGNAQLWAFRLPW